MSKYQPLEDFLKSQDADQIPMTFADVERVIGEQLPPAAYAHRAWWSNNPRSSVATAAWLRAGFESSKVRMQDRCLIFRRAAAARQYPAAEAAVSIVAETGQAYAVRGRHPLIGALKGTVRIMPGTDLTQPADPDWGSER